MNQDNIESMSSSDQADYWTGQLCISVAKGNFRELVGRIIDFYLRVGYERGLANNRDLRQ